MSLQREHRAKRISHGAEYKLTLPEFVHLINLAYQFLRVAFPADVGEFIFECVDTDKDGLITYVQYFQVIQQYVCIDTSANDKPQEPLPPKVGGAENIGP
jgi:hypothetical protein